MYIYTYIYMCMYVYMYIYIIIHQVLCQFVSFTNPPIYAGFIEKKRVHRLDAFAGHRIQLGAL